MAYLRYILSIIFTLIILFIFFYRFWFLRKPKRHIPKGDVIVSPANGRIGRIVEVNGKEEHRKGLMGKVRTLTKDVADKAWLIVIVMTPLNVHYQRAPYDGEILRITYRKGKLLNAVLGAEQMTATVENEKNEMLIKTGFGRMKVIQVAGLVAKRIVCYAKKNQNIKKGEILGLIRMGSQVCIVLPKKGIRLRAEQGQHVIDGETIIAETAVKTSQKREK